MGTIGTMGTGTGTLATGRTEIQCDTKQGLLIILLSKWKEFEMVP